MSTDAQIRRFKLEFALGHGFLVIAYIGYGIRLYIAPTTGYPSIWPTLSAMGLVDGAAPLIARVFAFVPIILALVQNSLLYARIVSGKSLRTTRSILVPALIYLSFFLFSQSVVIPYGVGNKPFSPPRPVWVSIESQILISAICLFGVFVRGIRKARINRTPVPTLYLLRCNFLFQFLVFFIWFPWLGEMP